MKRPVVVPRQESLMYPIVKNPFVHNLQLSTLDIVRIVFMSITIAPVRLVSLALLFGLAWLLAAISLAYRTPEEKKKPLEGWRNTHRVHSTCVGQERGSKLQDKYNKRNPQKSPLGGKMAPDNHFS